MQLDTCQGLPCSYASDLENELGAPKCMHVCVQALKCAWAHAHTHSHTNVLFILLFIHQPIPTRQKGRLRIAWLNNNRITCLNIGRVITDTIPNFSLWGFLNTLESTLGFPVSRLIHTHILRSVPCRHPAAMWMDAYLPTHSPDTFICSSPGFILIY